MILKRFALILSVLLGFLAMTVVTPSLWIDQLAAQNNNNNNNNNNDDDDDDTPFSTYNGVKIDANGVLSRDWTLDNGRLSRQQIEAAKNSYAQGLTQNIKKFSPIRYVSLNRMEKCIVQAQGVISEEMKYLAGLQRIQYVFYFPETKDIVIAGPAEGWFPGFEGSMMGMTTQKPVCELQDLVVALRAYGPDVEESPAVVGCSIDPTEEGSARMQQFIKEFGRHDGPGRREAFIKGLRKSLGYQTIRVDGISPNTHAAVVMVAADYRMKRIGIGVETAPVPITTFISKAKPGASNAVYRWYFVPDYKSVVMTEDKTALELIGEGVKLVAEDELVDAITGKREAKTGKVDGASRAFANSFTQEYPKLAKKSLVFAQLRNFVDMLVCAAHIQQQDFYGQAQWNMEFLGNEDKYAVQTVTSPTHIRPVVGYRATKSTFMAPIGGGVEIEPTLALDEKNMKKEDKNQVSAVKSKVKIELQENQWWWD